MAWKSISAKTHSDLSRFLGDTRNIHEIFFEIFKPTGTNVRSRAALAIEGLHITSLHELVSELGKPTGYAALVRQPNVGSKTYYYIVESLLLFESDGAPSADGFCRLVGES